MNRLLQEISSFEEEVTFSSLKKFIERQRLRAEDFLDHLKEPERSGDYGRNILSLEPFECVLINWPPGTESAVHHHDGLFGYVHVLEGELDNVFYEHRGDELRETSIEKYFRGALIPEPDGVIHKLCNPSSSERAVTLHFYYPAIKSFDGMEIYNLEMGQMGVLSDKAQTASWQPAKGHFKKIEHNAFAYKSYEELHPEVSHFISNVVPKPDPVRIHRMNADYFCEQAARYDETDQETSSRRDYTEVIDELVADSIARMDSVVHHLDIATGTGRRAVHIRSLTNRDYGITGIDISKTMCEIARSRGLEVLNRNWTSEEIRLGRRFDVITFLYAFGHIATREERLNTLEKVAAHLRPGGRFFFDVFSLKNKHEWGEQALEAYRTKRLERFGYERGDVFYRKRGYRETAFLHYFTEDEVTDLLAKSGLRKTKCKYIGYSTNAGEMVSSEQEGNILIRAELA